MPLTARSMRNRHGWGIQTVEGTAMATAASMYETSLYDGGLHPQADEVPFETSDTNDVAENFYIRRLDWMDDATIPVDMDSIGSLFSGHLGNDVPSGAGPYTHAITKTAPKFLTFYEQFPGVTGGTDYWVQGVDGVVKGIEISSSAGEVVKAKLDVIGKTATFNVSAAPTFTRDMTIATAAQNLATQINATLNVGAGTVNNCESLVITSSYPNLSLVQTDASTPTYVSLGKYECGFSATVVLTAAEFQTITGTFWGTTTITTNMAYPTNPTLATTLAPTFTFQAQGGTASRSVAFAFAAQRVTTEFAPVNPSGEAVRMTLTGKTRYNAAPLTVTAINARATY